MEWENPTLSLFGTELSRRVRSHSHASLQANLGMGPDEPGQLCTEEMTAWNYWSYYCRIYRLLWSSARVHNELLTNHISVIKTQGEGRWTRQGWIIPCLMWSDIFALSHYKIKEIARVRIGERHTVQITFIFIGQTRLVFGNRVCTCVTKHPNAFRTFLNWLKNSKRVWHEQKRHISSLPLFANFDLWV